MTHRTNLDAYDRLPAAGMAKAGTIAPFAYLAANRDEILPRAPQVVARERRATR
jgi:hypothetical protein